MILNLPKQGIDIEIAPPRYILLGESATGKTYLYNTIKKLKSMKDDRVKDIMLLNYDDTVSTGFDPVDVLRKACTHVVFIDQGELLLKEFPELADYINTDDDKDYVVATRYLGGIKCFGEWYGELFLDDGVLKVENPAYRRRRNAIHRS